MTHDSGAIDKTICTVCGNALDREAPLGEWIACDDCKPTLQAQAEAKREPVHSRGRWGCE